MSRISRGIGWILLAGILTFALPFALFVGVDLFAGSPPDYREALNQAFDLPYALLGGAGALVMVVLIMFGSWALAFAARNILWRPRLDPDDAGGRRAVVVAAMKHLMLGVFLIVFLRVVPIGPLFQVDGDLAISVLDGTMLISYLFNLASFLHFAAAVRKLGTIHLLESHALERGK